MDEIRQKIRRYILKNCLFTEDEAALSNDDSFLEKGIVDSTGMLELIAFMGDRFHISIEDAELIPANMDSVNRVASFIHRKQSGGH